MTEAGTWRTEPLTDQIDETLTFMRASNPFAEHTWGWETGRFVDFRWGGNIVREVARPGFFERHCTLVRRGDDLVAMIIAETGDDDHCVITPDEDPETLDWAVHWLLARRRGSRTLLLPSDEAAWIHDVLGRHRFSRGDVADVAWEYDLTDVPEPPEPMGYVVGTSLGPEDFPAIDRVLEGAFGGNRNRVPLLESLADNPTYRPELSIVARTGSGEIAAYCRGNVDPVRGIGSVDPVATHPDHQRRGLGAAIVLTCFAEQRRLGATRSFIGSGPPGSAGSNLYRKLDPHTRRTYSAWSHDG